MAALEVIDRRAQAKRLRIYHKQMSINRKILMKKQYPVGSQILKNAMLSERSK